jgi:hypothetical protein
MSTVRWKVTGALQNPNGIRRKRYLPSSVYSVSLARVLRGTVGNVRSTVGCAPEDPPGPGQCDGTLPKRGQVARPITDGALFPGPSAVRTKQDYPDSHLFSIGHRQRRGGMVFAPPRPLKI